MYKEKSETYMSYNILNKVTFGNIGTDSRSIAIYLYKLMPEMFKHSVIILFYPWMKSLGNIFDLSPFAARRLLSPLSLL